MAGKPSVRPGFRGDRFRLPDEYFDSMRRCNLLVADAEGNAPLQAFWLGVKCEYLADLSRRDENATRTRRLAPEAGSDIPVGPPPMVVPGTAPVVPSKNSMKGLTGILRGSRWGKRIGAR